MSNNIFYEVLKNSIPEKEVRKSVTNSLVNALNAEQNKTKTTNGMNAYGSTSNHLLDLYGSIGAMRNRSDNDIYRAFSLAFAEDKLMAVKLSFYARDILEGLGERRISRLIWTYLANNHPEVMRKNMKYIPDFGRWDDMYIFVGTPVEADMWNIVRSQFEQDCKNMLENKPVSLLAKWLKSVNTSSATSVALGKKTAAKFGLNYREYQKLLSRMRAYIDVIERKMSSNNWTEIRYQAVPSRAMNIYRKAFYKHDTDGFSKYIEDVKSGKQKINSGTLYPYDIVEKYMYSGYNVCGKDDVLEQQWKALPDFVDTDDNIMIMADTSGSMSGRPMATSVGLAIYFAERNHGAFAGTFMTFSSRPEFVSVVGNSLMERINNAKRASWQMNTNIEAAFNLVLNTAINNNVPQSDMPKSIIIITDLQFDRQYCSTDWNFYKDMKNRFIQNGYQIPNIVFWNVNSVKDTFHVQSKWEGVQIASGQSASVFKAILDGANLTPYDAMMNVLNRERYSKITV